MRQVMSGAAGIAVLLALALGAGSAPAAGTSGRTSVGMLGAVTPQLNGQPVTHSARAARAVNAASGGGPRKADNLTYNGPDTNGAVMDAVTNYAIFWVPSGYSQPPGYQSTVDRFFTDVAADSGKLTNVYSAATQYYNNADGSDPFLYHVAFGGSAVDTDAFPASGCTTNEYDDFQVIGQTKCLSDAQLETEIQSFADSKGWPHGPNTEFFIYTPENVGSCIPDSTVDSGYSCAYSEYCAYHSAFFSGSDEYVYANMPYPNQEFTDGTYDYGSDCYSGEFPNSADPSNLDDDAADEVINVSSHENNESITDPLQTGWWVNNPDSAYDGYEDGDLCAWYFPSKANLGGHVSATGGTAYNQVINGDHYFIQGEWSNKTATTSANSGCVWNYRHGPINVDKPTLSGTPTVGDTLTAQPGTWDGSQTSYKYVFMRCSNSSNTCVTAATVTTTDTSADYTLKAADDKHQMAVQVVAINAGGQTSSPWSDQTTTVDGEPEGGAPSLSGTATVGQTLTGDVDSGGWGFAPTKYASTLMRCDSSGNACKKVKTFATTAISYTLAAADDKHTLELQVVASNAAGTSDPETSALTAVVDGEPEGGTPLLSGTATVGQTLTGDVDSAGWGFTPTKYTSTLMRCDSSGNACKKVKTFTKSLISYTLVAADDKHTLELQVVASNAAGSSDPETSALTAVVDGEPAGGTAGITGTSVKGHVLTATTALWSPIATSYKYSWERCDSGGSACVVFKNVTSKLAAATYTLATSDVGHTIRVVVTAMNKAGASDPVTSSPTAVVTTT